MSYIRIQRGDSIGLVTEVQSQSKTYEKSSIKYLRVILLLVLGTSLGCFKRLGDGRAKT